METFGSGTYHLYCLVPFIELPSVAPRIAPKLRISLAHPRGHGILHWVRVDLTGAGNRTLRNPA